MEIQKGKFIVFEGIGGCGKSTQLEMALKYFQDRGMKATKFKFPRYDHPVAYFINKFKRGGYGPLENLSPEQIAPMYALDRFDAQFEISQLTGDGINVFCDRYDDTNKAYHSAKFINSQDGFKKALSYLHDLESQIYKNRCPDATIIFDISELGATRLTNIRNAIVGEDYDILEEKRSFVSDVRRAYLEIAKIYPGRYVIPCEKDGDLRSIMDIHLEVIAHIEDILKVA